MTLLTDPPGDPPGGVRKDNATVGSTTAHYAFIDALRGIAFLGVLAFHVQAFVPPLPPPIHQVIRQGHEGVQLFFLVSALTLFLSMDSRRKSERRPVVAFFIRRFFRIAPMFYLGALFYYFFDRVRTGGEFSGGSSLGCILATLTFTHGWSVPWVNHLVPGGWSVAVEMSFYLMVPFLFRGIKRMETALGLAFGSLLLGGMMSVGLRRLLADCYTADQLGLYTWYWLPAQLPIFFTGITLFFVLRPRPLTARSTATPSSRGLGLLLLSMAVYLIVALSLSKPALFLVHAGFATAFLLLAWGLALWPLPLLVNPFVRYVGQVSFSPTSPTSSRSTW